MILEYLQVSSVQYHWRNLEVSYMQSRLSLASSAVCRGTWTIPRQTTLSRAGKSNHYKSLPLADFCFSLSVFTTLELFNQHQMNHPAYFFLITFLSLLHGALAVSRSTPPAGSLTVGSSGTYKTVSAAVAAASAGDSIFIYAGTYKEQVYITLSDITIYGQTTECVIFPLGFSPPFTKRNHYSYDTDFSNCSTSSYTSNTVTITYNGSKASQGSDDASGTLRVHGNGFSLYNVKVVNTYGIGSQALALSASGTEQVRELQATILIISCDI